MKALVIGNGGDSSVIHRALFAFGAGPHLGHRASSRSGSCFVKQDWIYKIDSIHRLLIDNRCAFPYNGG